MAKTRPGWQTRGWQTRILATLCLILLQVVLPAEAHTNVERLLRVAGNGTTVGAEGFARGFWPRSTPGFFDNANVYLVPPNGNVAKVIRPDDKIAHPSQRTSNYTASNPPLKAAPGDMIALQYQENGHTTLPDNQPNKTLNRGTVYIYGTANLEPNANLLDIHYQWNAKGTGGDGKGQLLATRNFDDGRCYQDNQQSIAEERRNQFPKTNEAPMGDNLWCQNDLALPTNLPAGKPYTLIWVWDWPTMDRANVKVPPSSAPGAAPGENGAKVLIPELYTTIMDIDIVDPCDDILGEVKGPTCTKGGSRQTVKVTETDLNKAAIQEQVKNMFIVDVSALIDVGSNNNPSPQSTSTQPDSLTATGGAGGGRVKTTTTRSGVTVTTATLRPSGTKGGGRAKTTTVYDSTTITTVTVYPSTTSANPAIATVSTIVTKTVTTYSTTVTTTKSQSSSASPPGSAGTSGSASSVGSQTGTSTPTVTRFLKDSAANKGRREAGQWGFGRGHA